MVTMDVETKIEQSAVYHIANTADFLWTSFEDSNILYDPASGHTQVLNDFAREILDLLQDGPKTVSDLFSEFEQILEKELDSDLKNKIVETMLSFDNMGIIEPV